MRAIGLLLAEGDTKREKSCARRTNLRTNNLVCFPHLSPDLKRHCIHIKQSHLLATLFPETVNADCRQEARLPGPGKYGPMLTAGALSMFCTSSALCSTT